jgi:hypothetical protein
MVRLITVQYILDGQLAHDQLASAECGTPIEGFNTHWPASRRTVALARQVTFRAGLRLAMWTPQFYACMSYACGSWPPAMPAN